MSRRAVGGMTTDAVATNSQLEFNITESDVQDGLPAIWITGLAGVEEAYLWMKVGVTTPIWVEVEDSSGQATFSTTRKHFTINTAGHFGITKDATAGALVVSLEGVH